MTTLTRALGNSAIMLVSQLVTWTTTLILTVALGHSLGATRFGDFYLVISFGFIFSVLVEFGLDQQLVRAVARDRTLASTYLTNSLAIKGCLAVFAYLAILVSVRILDYGPELRLAIGVYSPILLFNAISASLTAVYKAHETVLYPAAGTILEKALDCVVAVFLLSRGYGIVAIVAVFVAGSAANAAWQALNLRRVTRLEATLDRERITSLIRGALPFLLYWVFGAIYFRIDIVLLSKLTDQTTVGWYSAAYRLFDTLNFLPVIVSGVVMFPILSRLSVQSRSDLRLAIAKALDVLLIAGVPICTGLFVLADPIIGTLYGRTEFGPSAPALRWLAIGLLFLYVNSIFSIAFVSLNQERRMTLVAALAMVLNIGSNWLLIPRFGHVGAAAATAATEGFILCYLLVLLPRDLLAGNSLRVFAKAAGAAVLMALAMYPLRDRGLVLLIPLGCVIYGLAGLFLRLIPAEDIRLVRQVIMAKRGRLLADRRAA